jgi:acetylornithine/N-succinyldiaminopimelate aminotransferase
MMQRNGAVVTDHPLPGAFTPELLVLDHGNGCYVTDVSGKEYLDFGAGISVNALGYGRDDLADVASEQMRRLIHVSNLFATEPGLALAERLLAAAPGDHFEAVQFTNSGSEANETALKMARLYAARTGAAGDAAKRAIACFSGAFHGRTMGALSCTPTSKYQEPFAPLVPGVSVLPFNDVAAARETLGSDFCAVIVEVVQGEGGLSVMSAEFAAALNEICRKHDIILIVDEVQTCLARTGRLFASELVGLRPDIITIAKPLAGGLPLAATLLPKKVNDLLQVGDHGTTFGGGPVTCAVANAVWDIVADENFIDAVAAKGRHLRAGLRRLGESYPDSFGELKGAGLLSGIVVPGEIAGTPAISTLMSALTAAGLLTLRSGPDVLRIAPPLIVTTAELDAGLALVEQAAAQIAP